MNGQNGNGLPAQPEHLGDGLDELAADVLRAQQANQATMEDLMRPRPVAPQGMQVNPITIIMLRMGVLFDMLLGVEFGEARTEQRLRYEQAVQQILAEQLAQILAQVNRSILVPANASGQLAPNLLRPGG